MIIAVTVLGVAKVVGVVFLVLCLLSLVARLFVGDDT